MDEYAYMYLSSADENDRQEDTASIAASNAESTTSGPAESSADTVISESDTTTGESTAVPPTPVPETPTKKRRGIRDFLSKANLQDQLLDKLFQQVIPLDGQAEDRVPRGEGARGEEGETSGVAGGGLDEDELDDYEPATKERPGFSVAIMSTNFRRFNARIGVVFRFQKRMERLLAWRRASHTLALLGAYTFVCLDPYLLTLLPPAVLLLAVLIPGFMARHPGRPHTAATAAASRTTAYYARGPPLAPPRTVKPVKELSRDFFRNMGDLQNSMEDFSVAHDQVVQLLVPATNFSDEALSSALFIALCAAAALLSVAAHLLPWRALCLVGGWLVVCSGHPAVARLLRAWNKRPVGSSSSTVPPSDAAASLWNSWVASDVILDEPPETREVEIFELQRRSHAAAAEWEPWVFSPSPYDPLSQPRLDRRQSRPAGARFFEDVLPPHGWEWSEKKWALDLWSRDWVEERIITGVEVETEGERWVYDMYNEQEQQQHAAAAAAAAAGAGLSDSDLYTDAGLHPTRAGPTKLPLGPSWEEGEGEEGIGRRGEWRRRRWVRMVKRKKITARE